jgi:hypothetical protein
MQLGMTEWQETAPAVIGTTPGGSMGFNAARSGSSFIPFLNQSAIFVGSVVALLDVLIVRLRRLLLAASILSLI